MHHESELKCHHPLLALLLHDHDSYHNETEQHNQISAFAD